ncbi:MAG: hypothetical protein COY42_02815 [Armatimonadetes bacterium CG_4_10_14_0_8_um_filter_66_14]|nr:MAG: hypothetical protein COY42_02815 [Armatimonadetes bacterium CG_4_10_14_0_8_um_filter_66_14]
MSLSPLEYLRHVLDEADYLAGQVAHLTREEFLRDETAKRAFVRSFEVMGEAVKQVPEELTNRYPQLAWRTLAGMRDKLIHHYFGVDYEIVWDAAVNKVPGLRQQVAEILGREDNAYGPEPGSPEAEQTGVSGTRANAAICTQERRMCRAPSSQRP